MDATWPALVDLGYAATIQKAMQIAIGHPLGGYYFGLHPAAAEAAANGGAVAACFGVEIEGQPVPDVIRYSLLLEAFFAGPTGQVEGYRADGDQIVPIYTGVPESGAAFEQLALTAEGMNAYCLDLMRAYGPSILRADYNLSLGLEPMRRLFAGWGGIPPILRPALLVDDAFCGNETLDVVTVLEEIYGEKVKVAALNI